MQTFLSIKTGVLVLFSFVTLTSYAKSDDMRIINVRVGQGDATLIQGPVTGEDGERINVLFDAGNKKGSDAGFILRAVLEEYDVKKLDYVIISHDHEDHLAGLITGGGKGHSALLGKDKTPGCDTNGDHEDGDGWLDGKKKTQPDPKKIGTCDDIPVLNWIDYGDEAIRKKGGHIEKYKAMRDSQGTHIALPDQAAIDKFERSLGGEAKMVAYASNGYIRGGNGQPIDKVTTPNERSIAMLFSLKGFDFLIAGDLTGVVRSKKTNDANVELPLGKALKRDGILVDILHVNHHGSAGSTDESFLADIKPNIAVISAGNQNGYDHPTNTVLRKLYDAGVYRTVLTSFGEPKRKTAKDVRDRLAVFQDDVVITTNGDAYTVSTSRSYRSNVRCVEQPWCSKGLD